MFDSFSYKYQKAGLNTVSNRLYHVNDDVSMTGIMSDDIDDEGVFTEENIQTANNYGYDEIGNLKFDKTEGIESIEWTAYGKVKSITRQANYYKTINDIDVYPSNLEFMYDAMGNRIAKIEKPRDANGQKSSADWKTTYYIRDAQGNPMATYKKSSETEAASFKLIEHPIYGSSRVGIDNYSLEFVGYDIPTSRIYHHVLGLKQYELTNHLGNVLTTISDKKILVENNGVIDHYVADITTVSDYYPFGSPMDERTFYSEKYRFGFQGQEAENEISGIGNYSFFKYRISDNRLGRFFAIDPLYKEYPWNSNYAFSENRVIDCIELEGLEKLKVNGIDKKHDNDKVIWEYAESYKSPIDKSLDIFMHANPVLVADHSTGYEKYKTFSNAEQFLEVMKDHGVTDFSNIKVVFFHSCKAAPVAKAISEAEKLSNIYFIAPTENVNFSVENKKIIGNKKYSIFNQSSYVPLKSPEGEQMYDQNNNPIKTSIKANFQVYKGGKLIWEGVIEFPKSLKIENIDKTINSGNNSTTNTTTNKATN